MKRKRESSQTEMLHAPEQNVTKPVRTEPIDWRVSKEIADPPMPIDVPTNSQSTKPIQLKRLKQTLIGPGENKCKKEGKTYKKEKFTQLQKNLITNYFNPTNPRAPQAPPSPISSTIPNQTTAEKRPLLKRV